MKTEELTSLYKENIKRIRHEKNISQEKLAELADISTGYMSLIENGLKVGTFETIVKIANALEVEPYELLLPANKTVNYDSRKTKNLMNKFRATFTELVDTMEEFLKE